MSQPPINFDVVRASLEAAGASWCVWSKRRFNGTPYYVAQVTDRDNLLMFTEDSDIGPGVAMRKAWHKLQEFTK